MCKMNKNSLHLGSNLYTKYRTKQIVTRFQKERRRGGGYSTKLENFPFNPLIAIIPLTPLTMNTPYILNVF